MKKQQCLSKHVRHPVLQNLLKIVAVATEFFCHHLHHKHNCDIYHSTHLPESM